MKRDMDMNEVSDGKRYRSSDLAKLGCGDCEGCSSCCQDMGDTITLDPMDVYQLAKGLGKSARELFEQEITLHVDGGIILPNIKMNGERNCCTFLNAEGRCSVHQFRPGVCRLFPLGRIYEKDSFSYFLQVHECKKENRTKVRINKWLGISNLVQYEKYILSWHDFVGHLQDVIQKTEDDGLKNQLNSTFIQLFYLRDYDLQNDFYVQFQERLKKYEAILALGE